MAIISNPDDPLYKKLLLISCPYCFYSPLFVFLFFRFGFLLGIDRVFLVGVGIVQFGKGRASCHIFKRNALFSLTIRLLSNGGFCIASSFRSLFLLFFSLWVQSTGAFCELVRVVCQASEFRVFQHSQCNCVYSFRSSFYSFPIFFTS